MNIRSDYLEALKRQQEPNRKTSGPTAGAVSGEDGFAALFSQEIGQNGETDPTGLTGEKALTAALTSGRTAHGKGIDASMLVSALGGTGENDEAGEASLLETITGQASGLLDSWDQYAQALSGGASQRSAWEMLAGMDKQTRALRDSLSGLPGGDADLESMLNELEVMSATEKFKFNRGDYS